ncbi:unnamed protein product [Absidia cylindrospora]
MKNEHSLSTHQPHYVAINRCNSKSNHREFANIPEFVKKLFSMLEENAYPSILSWGLDGKTFVVIEPTEFSKLILPKHFKHGNFASFVRQLNKYDFHKIRHQNDDFPFGHHAWEFCHSHFQYNRKELLRGIKRKPTSQTNRKIASSSSSSNNHNNPPLPKTLPTSISVPSSSVSLLSSSLSLSKSTAIEKSFEEIRTLTHQINEIQQSHLALTKKLRSLAQNQHLVVETISTFNNTMTVQDDYIQDIFQTKNNELHTNASDMFQSYQTARRQQQDKLELIIKYVQERKNRFSSFCLSDQGTLLEPPPPPILVPPTVIPGGDPTPRWGMAPRVLLAVNSINNGKIIKDQIFQWLQSFGCVVESIFIDPSINPFHASDQFDLLFVDESIVSTYPSILSTMRKKNPWVPLVCLCEVVSDQRFIEWMRQGITDVLSRPFEQQSIHKMVRKYCSHMKKS